MPSGNTFTMDQLLKINNDSVICVDFGLILVSSFYVVLFYLLFIKTIQVTNTKSITNIL